MYGVLLIEEANIIKYLSGALPGEVIWKSVNLNLYRLNI